jgi:hypothetical protein
MADPGRLHDAVFQNLGLLRAVTATASASSSIPDRVFIIMTVNFFYWGGFDTPDITLSIGPSSTLTLWLDWRPESTSSQSHTLTGLWTPIPSGSEVGVAVTDGKFDVAISGFYLPQYHTL